MQFSDIPGLADLKQTLIRGVASRHVAHAQLFGGNPGSGHLALALAYATYLNCENPQPTDACGRCPACLKMGKLVHPDFHQVFPVTTTKQVTSKPLSENFLPEWRKFLLESPYQSLADWLDCLGADNKQGNISVHEARGVVPRLSLKAYEATYKVLLLWLPELMNNEAANALLKVLEEPPPRTIFLLVCQQSDQLLPTIRSRTQVIRVRDFDEAEVQEYLTGGPGRGRGVPAARAAQIAALCEGNLAEATRLGQAEPSDELALFRTWMRACYRADLLNLTDLTEQFARLGKEEQKGLLQYGLAMFRAALLWNNGAAPLVRREGDERAFLEKFVATVTNQSAERLYHHFNEASYHLERNANAKILFLDLSLTVAGLLASRAPQPASAP